MNNEEIDDSPYCEVCGTCGCIGCCGIRNFISEHIEGKTNCKNEGWIIQELINLCEYKDEVFKENKRLNNIINELEKYLEDRKTHYCIGCSNIYEDSLGKTRLVNEDIFNEVTKIKDKLKELKEGDNND